MSIWQNRLTDDEVREIMSRGMLAHLGIALVSTGDDYLEASMPVDYRTHQPMGILHGGASVVLAESLGSLAGIMAAPPHHTCVGLEINANHLSSVRSGLVYGRASALHIGRSTQVWNIDIRDEQNKAVCVSRLTLAVLKSKPQ